jgi:hypothetical protein
VNELYKPPNAVLTVCLVAGGKLSGTKKLKHGNLKDVFGVPNGGELWE